MKTLIDSRHVNMLIVGEYTEEPIMVDGCDVNTPFEEKYKWIIKEDRIAEGKSFVRSLQVIITDPKKPNNPVQISLPHYQLAAIVKWYNDTHDKFCDPVAVDFLDEY